MSAPGTVRPSGAPSEHGNGMSVCSLAQITRRELATYSTPVRGSLTVVESGKDVPFSIARIFYIHGAGKNSERGAHAHRETWQAFIAAKGHFSIELTDGYLKETYQMDDAKHVLIVPPMIWARLFAFSKDSVCLVLASSLYDPQDYIREWEDFVNYQKDLASLESD